MNPKSFTGFPAKTSFTPIPDLFFSNLVFQIEDVAELKLVLHLFWLLHRKRGYPRFATYDELLNDKTLLRSLSRLGQTPEEALARGLALAISRGTLLPLKVEQNGKTDDLYFLNTESGRRDIAQVKSDGISLKGETFLDKKGADLVEQPNIFALYEQNIGMLTPLIAEELKQAEKLYPDQWIEEAIRESVSLNKRNWRYISRILERWSAEGKADGKTGRHSRADIDAKEYLKGKYGHLIRH